ncbi:hypothetical protein BT69DRAFT_1278253 [Atractiella rhizophila]|nr:hypothetical protein BT69DRAFT_1278253 [Atractiella rhizophila]
MKVARELQLLMLWFSIHRCQYRFPMHQVQIIALLLRNGGGKSKSRVLEISGLTSPAVPCSIKLAKRNARWLP